MILSLSAHSFARKVIWVSVLFALMSAYPCSSETRENSGSNKARGHEASSPTQDGSELTELPRNTNNSSSAIKQDSPGFLQIGPNSDYQGSLLCGRALSSNKGQFSEIISLFPIRAPSSCGAQILAVGKGGQVMTLGPDGGLRLLGTFQQAPELTAYSSEHNLLAVSMNKVLKVFSLNTGMEIHSLSRLASRARDMSFAPNGHALLIGANDSRVYRWKFLAAKDADTIEDRDKVFERYIGHSNVVSAVEYHPFGRLFFSGDWHGSVSAWLSYDADAFGGEYDKSEFAGSGLLDNATRKKGKRKDAVAIDHLAVGGDGKFLFLGLKDGRVEVFQVRGFINRAEGKSHKGILYDLEASDDGKYAASVGRDGFIRLWKLSENTKGVKIEFKLEEVVSAPSEGARSIAFLPGSSTVVAFSSEGKLVKLSGVN